MIHKFNKQLNVTLFGLLLTTMLLTPIVTNAQRELTIDPDNSIFGGFKSIQFPTFFSLDQIQHFSPLSYAAFLLSFVFLGIGLYWVYLVIRAGIKYLNSQGDAKKIEESTTQIKSVGASIALMFLFVAFILLVGAAFGLGGFWTWPKKLSICKDGSTYITIALELPNLSENSIDNACFSEEYGNYRTCLKNCPVEPTARRACENQCYDDYVGR
jgi:hypothetical protein